MYVKNLASPRTGRPVANQFVVEVGEKTYFQSYDSVVAVVYWDYEECCYMVKLGPDWNYSKTTMKYLNLFLQEYYQCDVNWNKTSIESCLKSGTFIECINESDL